MKNDPQNITLDKDLKLVLIDSDPILDIYESQMVDRIKLYIEENQIDSIGSTIVMHNAKDNLGAPSGTGTMMNLYNLFYAYFHFEMEV